MSGGHCRCSPDMSRSGYLARSHRDAAITMQLPMISHKAARFTESVIRGMTIEARRYGAVNLAQGMPDFPAPAEVKAAACRAIEDDINQYAITWGAHEPAPGDRRARRLAPGPAGRPRDRDHRHLRQHRGDAGDAPVADQSRRRGDPHPAVLRELLARLRPRRRDAAVRPAPAAGLAVRPRRAGRRVQRPDQGDHPLQPQQPDRDGLLARRPRGRRRALPQVGRDRRSPTRSTSTSSTTAGRTSPWPASTGCGSAR